MSNPVVSDLNSFINTSRYQREQSMSSNSPRVTTYYPSQPSNFESPSQVSFDGIQQLQSISPDDLHRMKYKIDLDKQVAEKKQRRVREWQTNIERDRKYVQHQPFGKHDINTLINQNELQEILTRGRAPSPSLDMPQQLSNSFSAASKISNEINSYGSSQQPTYNNYPQYTEYPTGQTKPLSPQKSDITQNTDNPDFHRFYGPITSATGSRKQVSTSSGTTQPIKGDAHDPFLLFDPNKEGQNVFNMIPEQDLYDPWGRPGCGAPLVHKPTGQKYTRYSGSLQEKLGSNAPLEFHSRKYSGNIHEQKRDLESEQKRRQDEEAYRRSNAGDTAEWITQLEGNRYPLKLHLPTTETTREYIGVRGPPGSKETRSLYDHLAQQTEERTRLHKINQHHNSIAELQHTAAQNSWWGKSGGGAPSLTSRRHNVQNTLENNRPRWTANHLGQMVLADDGPSNQVKFYDANYLFAKSKGRSNHKNFYEQPIEK